MIAEWRVVPHGLFPVAEVVPLDDTLRHRAGGASGHSPVSWSSRSIRFRLASTASRTPSSFPWSGSAHESLPGRGCNGRRVVVSQFLSGPAQLVLHRAEGALLRPEPEDGDLVLCFGITADLGPRHAAQHPRRDVVLPRGRLDDVGRFGWSTVISASGERRRAATSPACSNEDLPEPDGPVTTSGPPAVTCAATRSTSIRVSSARPKKNSASSAPKAARPRYGLNFPSPPTVESSALPRPCSASSCAARERERAGFGATGRRSP